MQLSDLDIVNHANNVKYLEWCLNTIDRKFTLKQKIKGFEMNFLKELNWNDEAIISKNEKYIHHYQRRQSLLCIRNYLLL